MKLMKQLHLRKGEKQLDTWKILQQAVKKGEKKDEKGYMDECHEEDTSKDEEDKEKVVRKGEKRMEKVT